MAARQRISRNPLQRKMEHLNLSQFVNGNLHLPSVSSSRVNKDIGKIMDLQNFGNSSPRKTHRFPSKKSSRILSCPRGETAFTNYSEATMATPATQAQTPFSSVGAPIVKPRKLEPLPSVRSHMRKVSQLPLINKTKMTKMQKTNSFNVKRSVGVTKGSNDF